MGTERKISFGTTMAFLAILSTADSYGRQADPNINIQDYHPSFEENLKMKPDSLTARVIWFGNNEQVDLVVLFAELARSHSRICHALYPLEVKEATGQFNWPTYGPIFTYFNQYHQGLDISPPFGTPVAAADGGIVVGNDENYAYGKHILIYHGPGIMTLYAHLFRMDVELGQRVQKSQLIGRVGSTGLSTGPHLHFETLVGCQPQDPLKFLPR